MSRFFVVALLLLAASASAQVADDVNKVVADALHTLVPRAKVDTIVASSLPGFYAAVIEGHVLYVSADGKYIIQGQVYDVPAHREISDEPLAGLRKQGIAKIPQEKRLVFAPPHPKYKVTVFTDVDCPYCRNSTSRLPNTTSSESKSTTCCFRSTSIPALTRKPRPYGVRRTATVPTPTR